MNSKEVLPFSKSKPFKLAKQVFSPKRGEKKELKELDHLFFNKQKSLELQIVMESPHLHFFPHGRVPSPFSKWLVEKMINEDEFHSHKAFQFFEQLLLGISSNSSSFFSVSRIHPAQPKIEFGWLPDFKTLKKVLSKLGFEILESSSEMEMREIQFEEELEEEGQVEEKKGEKKGKRGRGFPFFQLSLFLRLYCLLLERKKENFEESQVEEIIQIGCKMLICEETAPLKESVGNLLASSLSWYSQERWNSVCSSFQENLFTKVHSYQVSEDTKCFIFLANELPSFTERLSLFKKLFSFHLLHTLVNDKYDLRLDTVTNIVRASFFLSFLFPFTS